VRINIFKKKKAMALYSITLINKEEEKVDIHFDENEYENMMEMIVNTCAEDIGDCRGRAWCGTCQIELLQGELKEEVSPLEEQTLDNLPNRVKSSRLACQIQADQHLNGNLFRLLKDF